MFEDDPIEVIEDLLRQFAYRAKTPDGRLALWTGGLSALEAGFNILGWNDPEPWPDAECQKEGCHEEATCGTPTPDGYKRLCGDHYREIRPR